MKCSKLFVGIAMELLLTIEISKILSVISVKQSWQSDRDEYDQPAGRGSSWFRPNFRDNGYKRDKSRNRTSRAFRSTLTSLS